MTRWRRSLSEEERRLWEEVARFLVPMPGRPPTSPGVAPAAPTPVTEPAPSVVAGPLPELRPASRPRPALAPLERRTLRALARGNLQVDATLDLHGRTQAQAHAALRRFLLASQARGCRLVQIVTGKGRPGAADGFDERGVLRRVVPLWLGGPDLGFVVLGFEEAAPHRGGAGALYVRLRRAP